MTSGDRLEFKSSNKATAHGGQMAINALAGEYGLWKRVRTDARLDPRTHKGKGFDPVIYVAACALSSFWKTCSSPRRVSMVPIRSLVSPFKR